MSLSTNKEFYLRRVDCLDHGFVELVDFMGDDSTIAKAARVSYQKGTKSVREDAGLVDYLVRNEHTSPIEMVEFVFDIKMPIFVARQWIRHRTASVNEISGRYSILPEEFYHPKTERMQKQSQTNKQGSADELVERADMKRSDMHFNSESAFELYNGLVEEDLSRELARIVLPLSTYTQMIWKMDLKNLLHFLRLRLDSHAQYEIRVYAEAIRTLIRPIVPHTLASFENHIINGTRFSEKEMRIIKFIIEQFNVDSLLTELTPTEYREFKKKLG